MQFIISLLLAGFTLLTISLQRTYHDVPPKELRRRARRGDSVARTLYRAVAYGYSLRVFLWALVGFSAGIFFVQISYAVDGFFAVLVIALVLWIGFLWLPKRQATQASVWLASRLSPALAWALQYIHPVIDKTKNLAQRLHPVHIHTGLYEKEDLLELIEKQRSQTDNRMTQNELEIAAHALTFGDKLVCDVLTPRRVVKMIEADETIGPILMSELHDSGFSRFPVYEGKTDNIVGVLHLRDLVSAKSGGKVSKTMQKEVCFVHENQNLQAALQAILKTRQQLFIVVNSFEEYVGVISIEDVLEEIIGDQIVDEFDQYDDMRAVAALEAEKDHEQRNHVELETTGVEVVE